MPVELGGQLTSSWEDARCRSRREDCVTARMVNGGQSCIAGKRFIVVRSILDEFEKAVVGGDEPASRWEYPNA